MLLVAREDELEGSAVGLCDADLHSSWRTTAEDQRDRRTDPTGSILGGGREGEMKEGRKWRERDKSTGQGVQLRLRATEDRGWIAGRTRTRADDDAPLCLPAICKPRQAPAYETSAGSCLRSCFAFARARLSSCSPDPWSLLSSLAPASRSGERPS